MISILYFHALPMAYRKPGTDLEKISQENQLATFIVQRFRKISKKYINLEGASCTANL
jgi:hypothetical protein